jgi:hypothetical protein
MKGAKQLLKQIKATAIKIKKPAVRAVPLLRTPRPLARKPKLFKF